jgi:hypothetical protein
MFSGVPGFDTVTSSLEWVILNYGRLIDADFRVGPLNRVTVTSGSLMELADK